MTREVKNVKVAFKGGQCGRMDHHVWQVVPGTSNTVREKSIWWHQWCNEVSMIWAWPLVLELSIIQKVASNWVS